jgi:hypothetical protein
VSVRHRHAGDLGSATVAELAAKISRKVAERATIEETTTTGGGA